MLTIEGYKKRYARFMSIKIKAYPLSEKISKLTGENWYGSTKSEMAQSYAIQRSDERKSIPDEVVEVIMKGGDGVNGPI